MNTTTKIALLLTAGTIISQPLMALENAAAVPALKRIEAEATAGPSGELSDTELAKKLANPVASLISLPIQTSYTSGWGADGKGDQFLMNIQPVIPFKLSDDWNLVSRTILPVIRRTKIDPRYNVQAGIGDVVQSVFFTPTEPVNGWILGAGPVFLLPTGTNDLSAKKWGMGPTAVALKQIKLGPGHLTFGGLANHIWSTGGSDEVTNDISRTFINPFLNYTNENALSFILMSEMTYDWNAEQWDVPIFLECIKMGSIGKQKVSYGGGVFYNASSIGDGPEDFGFRLVFTMLFPK